MNLERYAHPEVQAELDAFETADALALLKQLGSNLESAQALRIVKLALRSHWSAGWAAAGGPSGAPDPPSKKPPRKAKAAQ